MLSADSSPSAAFAALHTFSSTSLSLESMVFLCMSTKWVSPVRPFSKSMNPSRSTSCHADSLQSTYDLSCASRLTTPGTFSLSPFFRFSGWHVKCPLS
eukprot:31418-Pelagococcus_subviridis.AAC.12